MKTPNDLELAKQHRMEDLQAAIDRAEAVLSDDTASTAAVNDALRHKGHAERELEHIETLGYAWPFNTGYPVDGPAYDDTEQQRRLADGQ